MDSLLGDRTAMPDKQEKLDQLRIRLEHLEKYEKAFTREINDIRREIDKLLARPELKSQTSETKSDPSSQSKEKPQPPPPRVSSPETKPKPPAATGARQIRSKSNFEKFIGIYLISIIGVLVTIIGVAIGAKYAIDNNLISPLMRIVFGYAVGLTLCFTAIRLKSSYRTFSAVLLSGGLAILYFITFFAYDYYALIPQIPAFLIMAGLTAGAVVAALVYDRRVIAHIGLVGAYAVPFLLSEGSNRAGVLFSYVLIVNIGILAVSAFKYWRYLLYSAFAFTWLIFGAWYGSSFVPAQFAIGLGFASAFFIVFYTTFLAFKLFHKEPLGFDSAILVILNSFTYFGFGYYLLAQSGWASTLGLFAVINALVHFIVAALINEYKLGDKNAFYLAVALAAAFLTIAAPIEFEGNWLAAVWLGEGTFLFIIGRVKRIRLFEHFSYPVLSLAILSLMMDWTTSSELRTYKIAQPQTPIFNGDFATSFFASLCFGALVLTNRFRAFRDRINRNILALLAFILPIVFLVVLYNTFRIEISTYFYALEIQTAVQIPQRATGADQSLNFLNGIWQINYSLFFLAALAIYNLRKLESPGLGFSIIGLSGALILATLTFGLSFLDSLRDIYVSQLNAEILGYGIELVAVRYVTWIALIVLVAACYRQINEDYITRYLPGPSLNLIYNLGLAFVAWIMLSNELVTWLTVSGVEDVHKLGLSVLWGLYSLALIIFGIMKRMKHLRIFAIVLFAVTLAKLFFYDIASLETIPKTILFITIGFLLLIVSYLYNRYTRFIFESAVGD